jgi:predicted metal-dependent hydrolase
VRGEGLFNERRFWEAHDAWEAAWRIEHGDVRRMLHGLIQIAAGCHHAVSTGRPHGAVKLLGSGLEKLQSLPDMGGLALERFRRDVAGTLDAARAWQKGAGDRFDAGRLPRLERR